MPLGRARPSAPSLEKVIGKEFDRRRPITSPTFFASDSVRPDAKKNKRRIIFVRQADGTFTGQYSDGANWQSFLATSVSYTTPAITYGTTAAAGSATTTIRSDSRLKYPTALMSAANSSTVTLTDDASSQTLTGSLGNISIIPGGVAGQVFLVPGGASTSITAIATVNTGGGASVYGLRPSFQSGNMSSQTVGAWDVSGSFTSQYVTSNIVGYDMTTFSISPAAGSDTANKMYGARLSGPLINNNTGGFTEVASMSLTAPRRLINNPTVTAAYGIIMECPTVSGTTQAGIYIKQRTAQHGATNRYGILIDGQNSGTNRYGVSIGSDSTAGATLAIGLDIAARSVGTTKYSIRTATDPEYFGGHVQMDDSVKVKLGTAQDAEIYYDGTDLIVDPDVVGTGVVRHSGKTALDDDTTIATGKNVILSTSGAGTKIGTATTQLLAFWNSAPVVQPATTGTASSMVAGGGAAVDDKATFTGGTGATAYRIDDIVNNLKTCGILKT